MIIERLTGSTGLGFSIHFSMELLIYQPGTIFLNIIEDIILFICSSFFIQICIQIWLFPNFINKKIQYKNKQTKTKTDVARSVQSLTVICWSICPMNYLICSYENTSLRNSVFRFFCSIFCVTQTEELKQFISLFPFPCLWCSLKSLNRNKSPAK